MRLFLFIAIVVLSGTAGDLAVTHAMKKIANVDDVFKPASMIQMLLRAFRIWWMWLGIGLMAVSFFSLLTLLSWADVSIVVPATAANYVAGALGAKFLLREKVAPMRWAGVLFVCAGVALLSVS